MLIVFCACLLWPVRIQALTFISPASKSRHDLNIAAAQGTWHRPQRNGTATPQFVGSRADLGSTELFSATLVVNTRAAVVGGTLVYTLTLVNSSAAPEPFDVADTLPDSLMLVDAPGMTASAQTLTARGTLDGGAQRQFIITAQVRVYRFTVENAATVRLGNQVQTTAAPAVRIASAASSPTQYLPLMVR